MSSEPLRILVVANETVGGPYEYGVPGAVHGVFKGGSRVEQPAGAATEPAARE